MKGTSCPYNPHPYPLEHLQLLFAKLTHLQKSFECGLFSFQRDPAGSARCRTTGPHGTCSKSTPDTEFAQLSFLCQQTSNHTPQTFNFKFSHHELSMSSVFPLELQQTYIKVSVESSSRPLTGREMRRKTHIAAIGRETCLCPETTFSEDKFFLTSQSLSTSAYCRGAKGHNTGFPTSFTRSSQVIQHCSFQCGLLRTYCLKAPGKTETEKLSM